MGAVTQARIRPRHAADACTISPPSKSTDQCEDTNRSAKPGVSLRVGDIGNISLSKPHVEIVNAYDQVGS